MKNDQEMQLSAPPPTALTPPVCSAFMAESQRVQWWLGKLDRHDNVKELTDGAHSEAAGAHEAMYLLTRLGLADKAAKYAVVRCEVFEPVPDGSRANQDALKRLNGIGLGQNLPLTHGGPAK